jgi:hypothetical protein
MNLTFYQILANNLVANITNFTVWFAVPSSARRCGSRSSGCTNGLARL